MAIQISEHFNLKKLFRFVLPSIFMMVVTSVYGVIDGFFISNFVGKTPFAAINLIMPFTMILGGTGFMIGTGGTALVSKAMGENNPERANRYFTMMIMFAVILGVALTVLGISVMRPVAQLLGGGRASGEMLDYSVLYGRIVVGFTAFYMLQNIFQSFLAAAEKPKLGLLVTLIAGCANAALDALFIVVFKWGVAGAAVATGLGQVLGELYNLTVHAFRLFSFSFIFSGVAIYSSGFFTALNNGLISAILSFMRSLVFQVAFVFLLPFLFGTDGIWWAMFATEAGASVVAVIFFIVYRKKYRYA